MGMYDNEVAADNRMRELEKLTESPAGKTVVATGEALGIASIVTVSPLIGSLARALGIAGKISALGVPTVTENLKYLGDATEQAISRIEKRLEAQGLSIVEIGQRIESPEFQESMAATVLQTQRTTQKARLKRLALLLANSVTISDLDPESLDDMARAVVELRELDIQMLRDVHECELKLGLSSRSGDLFQWWQEYWNTFSTKYPGRRSSAASGAFGRLGSFGFVYGAEATSMLKSPVSALYRITEEGKRFLERIQNIE